MLLIMFGMAFASIALIVWAAWPNQENRLVRARIMSEVSALKEPTLFERLARLVGPINAKLPTTAYVARTTKTLEAAGLRLPALQFLVIQEFGAMTGALGYFALHGKTFDVLWLLGCAVVGFMIPTQWLNNRIKERRLTVTRDLPEIVDLLTLCVGAGSDFMGALNRIVREFRPCPVREELGILLQEVRVGKRRRDALRGFALRLQTPETNTFARTLIQVDRMGTGLAEALNILSEDMRIARYHWAERFAQQAPMKMLIPLLFSLGAAMVIVAGPILFQFMRGGLMSGPQMTAEETTKRPQMPNAPPVTPHR